MISVINISKSYKSKNAAVQALSNITLEIEDGEIFGLIGPDGAGKTTLFRILTTLLLADSGTASVDGMDVVSDFRRIRNEIGYMPGRFSLYQDLSVEENLEFFADVFGTTIEENYELIKPIFEQIAPFKKRRAGRLSGGMKQKLALCCALIHKPKVLFLDEPTTGVDPVSRKEFWDMLKNLKKQGITIMVSTPYMDEASLCDRIALIQAGKIMSNDPPANIVSSYKNKLYRVKAENNYHLLESLRRQENVRLVYIAGEYLHLIFNGKDIRVDFPDCKIEEIKPTIEDCFIQLMQK